MRTATLSAALLAALFCATAADRAAGDTFGSGANSFEIEFVTIGNPNNADDTTGDPNPAGKVEYSYRMGKYEISRDMINKANAEGALGITLENMSSYGGNGTDRPATGVSWFEAAKFVNWLNTSKGHMPAYKFDGGGNFQLWTPSDTGYNPDNLYRNSLARYVLPSMDEWYKAAYYDPSSGVYYDYPTGSDTVPDGIDFAGDTTFEAVFSDGHNPGGPNDITHVGLLSPYGTAGQGGNVYEWEESALDLSNDSIGEYRAVRGGYWSYRSDFLQASLRYNDGVYPSNNGKSVGFRVASIPEPSTVVLLALGAIGVLGLRRRYSERPCISVTCPTPRPGS